MNYVVKYLSVVPSFLAGLAGQEKVGGISLPWIMTCLGGCVMSGLHVQISISGDLEGEAIERLLKFVKSEITSVELCISNDHKMKASGSQSINNYAEANEVEVNGSSENGPSESVDQNVPSLEKGILWNVQEVASYLRKSPRWVFERLRYAEDLKGSIPHTRLERSPRFIPEDIQLWVRWGCPPVADFKRWQNAERRGRRPR